MVLRLYLLTVLCWSPDYISSLRFLRGIHNISGCFAFNQVVLVTCYLRLSES